MSQVSVCANENVKNTVTQKMLLNNKQSLHKKNSPM